MGKKASKKPKSLLRKALGKQAIAKSKPQAKQAQKPSFTVPRTFIFSEKTLKESEFLRPSQANKDALIAQLKMALNPNKRQLPLQVEFSFASTDFKPEQIYLISVRDASGSPIPLKFSQLPEIKKQLSKIAISHIQK